MRLIGYWLPDGNWFSDKWNETYCLPQEIVGTLDPEIRERIANYLDAGTVYQTYRGWSWCRFRCGVSNEVMGHGERTDRFWIWPDGLSHYVRHHGIILPEEFISHVMGNKSAVAEAANEKDELEFWKKWCRAHRSPKIAEEYRANWFEAKSAANKREIALSSSRIAAEIKRIGLSQNRCIMATCQEKALNGQKFCALHSLKLHGSGAQLL